MPTFKNTDLPNISAPNQAEGDTLWKDFKKGNPEAFEQLVNHFYPILISYGQRLVRDKDFAQDCLQDFFIDLWSRRERLDDVQSVQAYFWLIAADCSEKKSAALGINWRPNLMTTLILKVNLASKPT